MAFPLQHPIVYQLPQQQADVMRACMFTLQHMDCVGIGVLWACGLWHTDLSLASRCLHTSHFFAYVWTSSFVVVRYCSRSSCKLTCTESNTNNTSSAGRCMVLISVNAVLRLLKRSTCVRGRTHLVVCRYLPVWRRATIALGSCSLSGVARSKTWSMTQ